MIVYVRFARWMRLKTDRSVRPTDGISCGDRGGNFAKGIGRQKIQRMRIGASTIRPNKFGTVEHVEPHRHRTASGGEVFRGDGFVDTVDHLRGCSSDRGGFRGHRRADRGTGFERTTNGGTGIGVAMFDAQTGRRE